MRDITVPNTMPTHPRRNSGKVTVQLPNFSLTASRSWTRTVGRRGGQIPIHLDGAEAQVQMAVNDKKGICRTHLDRNIDLARLNLHLRYGRNLIPARNTHGFEHQDHFLTKAATNINYLQNSVAAFARTWEYFNRIGILSPSGC